MFLSELPVSKEVKSIYIEARDIAAQAKKQLLSCHLLFSIFTIPCNARRILEGRKITEDDILSIISTLPPEPSETIDLIFRKSAEIAKRLGANQINSLHLLMAIARLPSSTASQALDTLGLPPHKLRNIVISALQLSSSKVQKVKWVKRTEIIGDESDEEYSETSLPKDEEYSSEHFFKMKEEKIEEGQSEEKEEEENKINELISQKSPSRYALDPEIFPFLSSVGVNLTLMAEEGKLHPLVGREKEIQRLIDILNKLKANNPCLIGEPGVGKTAIVEGLTQKIVNESDKYSSIADKIIISITSSDLLKRTHLRGTLAEKLARLKEEIKNSGGRIILFIDEIHNLVSQGSAGNGKDEIVEDIKSSLARGELPCIGATTIKEYQTHIQNDPALERRFQPIFVKEASPQETIATIKMILPIYEKHHKVKYEKETIQSAVRLSSRYITERCLPDKAINVIDLAGSRAQRKNKQVVSVQDIAEVVSALTDVPMEKLILKDSERILGMEEFLRSMIAGHEENIKRICRVITRNYAGFSTNRPMGSFLFMGPTGVGKTETVKVMSEFLFQNRESVIRLNMSEYSESHSVASLIGAPPGYVGYEEGGRLTEAMFKKPFQIVLFDEIDKAHRNVMNLLLQILDEGEIFDKRGRRVDFRNSIIVMTSNYGCEVLASTPTTIGFGKKEDQTQLSKEIEEQLIKNIQKFFTPELWARIEEKLIFHPLSEEHIKKVAKLLIEKSSKNLFKDKKIKYCVRDEVIDWLIKKGGYEKHLGARPMRKIISENIEDLIADEILTRQIKEGSSLIVHIKNDKPVILKKKTEKRKKKIGAV